MTYSGISQILSYFVLTVELEPVVEFSLILIDFGALEGTHF